MLILDSYTKTQGYKIPYSKSSQNFIGLTHAKNISQNHNKTENSPKILENNHLMDWFLQTIFTQKSQCHKCTQIQHDRENSKDLEICASLFNKMSSVDFSSILAKPIPSKLSPQNHKAILDKITAICYTWRQIYHNELANIKPQINQRFIDKIESCLKYKTKSNFTQQEIEESQKFIFEQMDRTMLAIYRENPKALQLPINRNESNEYKNLEYRRNLSLFCEYGAKIESKILERQFKNYLLDIPIMIKNSIKNQQIETTVLKQIEEYINLHRIHKMEVCGYKFFIAASEYLLEEMQERIADAIAQVLLFYSQPNSMEVNGYEISWTPYYSSNANDSYLKLNNIVSNAACADIQIRFQILIAFPTKFQTN